MKVLIFGCGGSMGRVLADLAHGSDDIEIAAGVDAFVEDERYNFPVFSSLNDCDVPVDVIVDFSSPKALKNLLDGALQIKVPLIIATTGHSAEDREYMMQAAKSLPIFQAANMSIGINLLTELLQKTTAVLGNQFDIEIIEKHHNLKKDAPSGTAYQLANTINQVFMDSGNFVFGRHTTSDQRNSKDIGIHAVRGGTIVGEHEVLFAGVDEAFELKHIAYSKQIFAAGALRAIRFMTGKPAGYYTMKEMIAQESTVTNMYTSDEDALVSIHDIPHDPIVITKIFKDIGEKKINLDMISQTAPVHGKVNISFTLPRKDLEQAMVILKDYQAMNTELQLDVISDATKISVTGPGMEIQSGVAAKVFEIMASRGIELKAVTTSETKISYVICQENSEAAIEAIKTTFDI